MLSRKIRHCAWADLGRRQHGNCTTGFRASFQGLWRRCLSLQQARSTSSGQCQLRGWTRSSQSILPAQQAVSMSIERS